MKTIKQIEASISKHQSDLNCAIKALEYARLPSESKPKHTVTVRISGLHHGGCNLTSFEIDPADLADIAERAIEFHGEVILCKYRELAKAHRNAARIIEEGGRPHVPQE